MATATKRNTFNNIADLTDITAASQTSTSGDQVSGLGGTGTRQVRADAGVRGNGLLIGGAAVSSFLTYSGMNSASLSAEIYIPYDPSWSAPDVEQQLLQIRDGSASKVSCNWKTDKSLGILNAAGTTIATLNAGAELPAGIYRLWIAGTIGTTSSNGRILYRLDNAATGANIDNVDTGTTANAGTTNYTETRYGKNNATGTSYFRIDDIAYRAGDVSVIDLQKVMSTTVTDSVGITDTVTLPNTISVTITDTIGIIDLPANQSKTITDTLTDDVGLTDVVDLVPTTGILARWCADTLIEGGTAAGALASWPSVEGGIPAATQATATSQPTLITSAPEFADHACVEFDGAADWLKLTGAALDLAKNTGSLAIFVAYAMADPAPTDGPRDLFALSTGISAAQHRMTLYSQATSLATQAGGRRLDTDGLQAVAGTIVPSGHAGVLFARFNWSAGELELDEDTTQVASSTSFQSPGTTSNTSSLVGAIGARANGAGEYFAGRIADILIYSDADETHQARVHNYLAGRYGLALTTGVTVEGGSLDVAVVTATAAAAGSVYTITQVSGPTVSPTAVAGTTQTWIIPRHVTDPRVFTIAATAGSVTRSTTVTVAPYDPNSVSSSSQMYAATGAQGSTQWEPLAAVTVFPAS